MLLTSDPSSFVEKLLPIERETFLWLNHLRSDFMDTFMYVYSDKVTWLPLAIILVVVLLYKAKWKQMALFILAGTIIGFMCDMFAADLIKPFFARLRPSHHPDFKDVVDLVLDRRGGRFGFISNHAANGFGIAIFTSLLFRYRYFTITAYSWVIITSYSRIYLGVHFITDILGGFIWGTFIGLLTYLLYVYAHKKMFKVSPSEVESPLLSKTRAHMLILAILLTVVYIVLRALFFPVE